MNIIVCDIETDSVRASDAEMIEIYMAIYSNKEITKEISLRIKPRRWTDKSEEAVKIHKITKSEAMKGLDWNKSMELIFDFLPEEPHYFLCHANRRAGVRGCYDYQVLSTHFNQLHSDIYFYFLKILPPDKVISTHSLVSQFLSLEGNDLKSACKHFGITLDNHHTAKADAIACLNIFKEFEDKIDLERFVESDFYDTEYNLPFF